MARRRFTDLQQTPEPTWVRKPAAGNSKISNVITWDFHIEPEPEDDWDKDRYCTPPDALAPVYKAFEPRGVGLDPCWDPDSIVKALAKVDVRTGACGLRDDWRALLGAGPPTVFYNPPYSSVGPWTGKASIEVEAWPQLEAIGLFPPHVDTIWWADTVWRTAAAVCFVSGRYKFLRRGVIDPAPRYASAFVLHAGDVCRPWAQGRFDAAFRDVGQVILNIDGKWGASLSKPKTPGFHGK